MRRNKKLILGLTAAFIGCTALLPTEVYAKEFKKLSAYTATAASGRTNFKTISTVTDTNSETVALPAITTVSFGAAGNESLDELVDAGIITNETASAMKAFTEKQAEEMKAEMDKIQSMTDDERKEYFESNDSFRNFKDPMEQMVEEKIITESEKTKIQDYYKKQMEAHMKEQIKNKTDRYVSEGILDNETAAKVADYLYNERANFTMSSAAAEAMPAKTLEAVGEVAVFEDRKFKNEDSISLSLETANADDGSITIRASRVSVYENLTKEGIITEDQQKAMEESDIKYAEKEREEAVSDALASLVKDGTITQEKADKVKEYLKSLSSDMQGLKETVIIDKNTTEGKVESVKASGIFDSLVEEGILTQSEADAVSNALHGTMGRNTIKIISRSSEQ